MTKPTTPDYIRQAVKRYDSKVKKVQVVFNIEKPDEAALYEAIEEDKEPLSTLAKRLLMDYYDIKRGGRNE